MPHTPVSGQLDRLIPHWLTIICSVPSESDSKYYSPFRKVYLNCKLIRSSTAYSYASMWTWSFAIVFLWPLFHLQMVRPELDQLSKPLIWSSYPTLFIGLQGVRWLCHLFEYPSSNYLHRLQKVCEVGQLSDYSSSDHLTPSSQH